MVTASRREAVGLSERLRREPHRFEFFQTVRLLERLADAGSTGLPVGADHAPEQECVRFRALPSLGFPAAPVARLRQPAEQSAPEMHVSFLGLTGPSGVLPAHYTALLIRRLRAKDGSLRDLLDLFNHRLVSLFYRAWEKYRLAFAYERARLDRGGRNPERVTQVLFSLVGKGTAGLQGRQQIPDEAFLYYSGHFAHQPRSAAALEQVLGDYFRLPVTVRQFQGQRLRLDADDVTRLPSRQRPRGLNCRLGVDAVLGDHTWDAQGKFRLRIGPLTYSEFCRFFPDSGDRLRPVCQLARSHVGPEFAFDVQLVLKPAEVPRCRLGGRSGNRPRLGWNTWLRSRPLKREADDVAFNAAE